MGTVTKDYYKILGVRPDATEEEIRERWLELVKHHHPDLESGGLVDERIKEINEAYQVLKQPLARWEYDLQRTCERELGKSSWRKWMPLCGFLFFVLVAGGLYVLGLEFQAEVDTGPPVIVSQIPETSVSLPPVVQAPTASETSKKANRSDGQGESVPKPSAPPLQVEKEVKIQEPSVPLIPKKEEKAAEARGSAISKPAARAVAKKMQTEQAKQSKQSAPLAKNIERTSASLAVEEVSSPSGQVKWVSDSKPRLIASEEEIRDFFTKYVNAYSRKDSTEFLSFFSPKAIQNQTDPYDEIRKIYTRFFRQSKELQYEISDLRIELYENGAEVRARYQVDQILRANGERKVWRGNIRWVLGKEDGVLKIISLDYQNQKSL